MKTKKYFLLFTFMFVAFLMNAQQSKWEIISNSKTINTEVNLLNSKSDVISLEFNFNAYKFVPALNAKNGGVIVEMPNCTELQIKGAPDLPKITQSVVIPEKSKMEINVDESDFIVIKNVEIAPSKGAIPKNINPDNVPFVYGDVYQNNEFFPQNIAELRTPYIISGVRGQTVVINPVQYNPVTKEMRIYTKIAVTVVKTDQKGVNEILTSKKTYSDPYFNQVYQRHFINYKNSKYTTLPEGGTKMLIVSYGDFMDEMQDYVDWKESIGFDVEMVDYATIGSSSALKTYVQNYYDQNGLTYLLLVGDHAQVPSYNASAGYSDNTYGYLAGSDHYLDIFVGRFSAETADEVTTQVERTIYYERDLSSTATWFNNGVGIASNEGTSGGGDDDESDEAHMDNIKTDLENYGYTISSVYQDGGSASQLSTILNSGAGIINYVGHGSDYTWASMVYTQANVNALTNNNKLPFVFSVACVVGNFTSTTCFAETWLRATNNGEPTGAIVFAGSTINQSWASPMCAQDEMNDLLVTNNYLTFTSVFVNGMFQMIDEYGSDGENMADTWTVFGDPSVQMRTPGHPEGPQGSEPTAPTAAFSASSTTVEEGATVTFNDNSTGTPTSWAWTFEGGSPSSSTSENPTVTYSTAGTYSVTLTVTNSLGTDTETKTGYITVQEYVPSYCTTIGENVSYEWIASVAVGDFSYASAANGGYADFSSQNIELTTGQSYDVTLTPGFASSSYSEYWKVWIDFDNNYTFDDDEVVYSANSTSAVSGTITIPSDATGTVRMRVSMKYNAEQTACETFSYGEVEDYSVTFTSGSTADTEAPTAPTALASSNVTSSSCSLSWTASTDNVGVTGYDVYQNGTLLASTTSTSYSVTGLSASTTYTFYVKAKDAAGNVSSASSSLSVTTSTAADTEAPTVPTNLASSSVTTSSCSLSWTASTDNVAVTGYDVYQNGTLLASTTSTSYSVTGLTASTTYTFYVKAKDAAGNVSSASSTLSVTTSTAADTEVPTAPTNLASSSVTTSSCSLSWTASTDNVAVTGYDVYQNGTLLASTTSTSYSVTGLTASTTYTFYVKAKDAAGNVSSASSTVSVTTEDETTSDYCTSQGNSVSDEWISSVVIGSFSNSSDAQGYTDFTGLTVSLTAGSSYSITLTPGFSGTAYKEYWKIWIDYDNNGTFDTDEVAFDAGATSSSAVTGTIAVPSDASGTTRMRVSMKYNGAPTACETFSYGEVEDYTVSFGAVVADTEAPTAPTGLAASGVTSSSLTLSWTASTDNVAVTGYDVYQNGTLLTTTTSTSYSVTGLTASTTYSYYIVAKDAAGNVSSASSTVSATTSTESITYCTSQGSNYTYEWIDLVQLGDIDNTSTASGYTDFTSLSTSLARGASATIYFSAGFKSSSYTEYWHVWIDFDHNGTFDDDEEMATGSSTSSSTLSGTFTVPTDAVLGSTRMRVTMKYNAAATSCETFSYGEVEDYTVNIVETSASLARFNVEAEELGIESSEMVKLYPNPVEDILNIELQAYRPTARIYNAQGMLIMVQDLDLNTTVDVSNLSSGVYFVKIDDPKEPIVKFFVKK